MVRCCKGTVHNVVDFGGAFVDFGLKTNGLLHRSELCNSRQHPSDVLAVGDIIEAQIISVDVKRNRIGLSVKSITTRKSQRITIITETEIITVNAETTIVIITSKQ